MMRRAQRLLAEDGGFSLAELAVYIIVLGILAAVVAASVLGLFRSEKAVSSLTDSANESQIFISYLNRDLRSAREVAVRDGGQEVVASVASFSTPITWNCVTWKVTGSGDERTITRNGKTVLEHAQPGGGGTFFATASGVDVPQGKEGTVLYDFRVATSSSGVVPVVGTVSSEAQGTLGAPAQCI